MSALQKQIGGEHYKKLKIQPMEYSMANGLDACQHTIIKYVTRFRDKGGIADLEKAKHCIEMLIEFEAQHPVEKRDLRHEWPEDESRIDAIGQNGPTAEHYQAACQHDWVYRCMTGEYGSYRQCKKCGFDSRSVSRA